VIHTAVNSFYHAPSCHPLRDVDIHSAAQDRSLLLPNQSSHSVKGILTAVLTAALLATSTFSAAGFGALAVGACGVAGSSWNYSSEILAHGAALINCPDSATCQIHATISNSCAAVAVDQNNCASGWAVNQSRRAAEVSAVAECANFGGSYCTLRSSFCDTGTPAAAAVAPVVPPGNAVYTTYDNRDLYGNDLRNVRGIDLSSCVSACRQESQCRAYSYDKWNRLCFLKSSAEEVRVDPRSISGLLQGMPIPRISSIPIRMERYRDKYFPGSGYRSLVSSSFEACEKACESEEACIAHSFQKTDHRCRLFDRTGEYFSNKSADSGAKRQSP
jgi:hypothetical protein